MQHIRKFINYGNFDSLYSDWIVFIFILNNRSIVVDLMVYIVIEYIHFYFK